jgi:hypothetical protein
MTSRKVDVPGAGPMIETTQAPSPAASQDIALSWDTPDGQPPKNRRAAQILTITIAFVIGVMMGVAGTAAYVQA